MMFSQKSDAHNRRTSGYRSNNKRHLNRQTNGNVMSSLNSSKNGGQPKDGGHQADEPGCESNLLQPNIRSGRTTPSASGGINASMQPYIQIAPQQYPQYIPYCPIDASDQSMFMPYGIYPPVPGE